MHDDVKVKLKRKVIILIQKKLKQLTQNIISPLDNTINKKRVAKDFDSSKSYNYSSNQSNYKNTNSITNSRSQLQPNANTTTHTHTTTIVVKEDEEEEDIEFEVLKKTQMTNNIFSTDLDTLVEKGDDNKSAELESSKDQRSENAAAITAEQKESKLNAVSGIPI